MGPQTLEQDLGVGDEVLVLGLGVSEKGFGTPGHPRRIPRGRFDARDDVPL